MPDLILANAKVITMAPGNPSASVVSIQGDRIENVSRGANFHDLRGPETHVIDCLGKTLVPGFVDAHCHVYAFAESLVCLNLSPRAGIRSISDIQDRIRDFCRSLPPGTWVRGKGYNEFYLAERRHPDRRDLDVAAPMHPVKLTHRSGHAHVLNGCALEKVGITVETGDPPGGFMDRELETGEPTGILYGMGSFLSDRIPPVSDTELESGLSLANSALLASGITSVQDASHTNDTDRQRQFESCKARGFLQPRLTIMRSWEDFERNGRTASDSASPGVRFGGVKILLGRVSGSLHPSQEELNEMVSAIHAADLQAIVHAVEEPEIEAACNAIAGALRKHGRPDHRHRIEHGSVCPPRLLRQIAELGITVVTQPSFIRVNGDRYLETVPEDQQAHLYAIGSMMKLGVPVGFSSDFPISDPNPMEGIQAAVTRRTECGWTVLPQEGIPVLEAMRAYTLGAAAANFEDAIKGSIDRGKLADMVLLSEDPRTADPAHIGDIRAILTIIGGRVAWSDPDLRY